MSHRTADELNTMRQGHWVALAAILLTALIVRLFYLQQPITTDEATSYVEYASQPLADALSNYSAPNNHLLNTLGMWVTSRVLGAHEWALRLSSLAAGLVLVGLVFAVGRALYSVNAGLLAAGLAATSMPLVSYSVLARGYSLQMVFLLLTLLLVNWLRRTRTPTASEQRTAWLLASVCAALSLYAVPSAAYGLLIVGMWAGVNGLIGRRWGFLTGLALWTAGTLTLTAVLYAPALLRVGLDGILSVQWERVPAEIVFYNYPYYFAYLITLISQEQTPVYFVVLAFGMIIGLFAHAQVRRLGSTAQLEFVPLLPLVLLGYALLMGFGQLLYLERTWLFILPFVCVSAAVGLNWALARVIPSARLTSLAVPLLAVLLPVVFWVAAAPPAQLQLDQYVSPDAAAVAAVLADSRESDALWFVDDASYSPVIYHLWRQTEIYTRPAQLYLLRDFAQIVTRQTTSSPLFVFDALGTFDFTGSRSLSRAFALDAAPATILALRTGTVYRFAPQPLSDGYIWVDETFDGGAPADWYGLEQAAVSTPDAGTIAVQSSQWVTLGYAEPMYWSDYTVETRLRVLDEGDDFSAALELRVDDGAYLVYLEPGNSQMVLAAYQFASDTWEQLAVAPLDVRYGTWYTVRAEVIGALIYVYLDDQLVLSVRDDRFPSGMPRLTLPPGAHIELDTFRIRYSGGIRPEPLTATFTGTASAGLPGAPGWVLRGSGGVRQDENGAQVLEFGDPVGWTVLDYVEEEAARWSDYRLELDFQVLTSVPVNNDLIVQTRYRPAAGAYNIDINQDAQTLNVTREFDETWTNISGLLPVEMLQPGWHTLAVEVEGETLRLALDNQTLGSYTLDTHPRGGVRLLVPPGGRVRVDDLRIRPVEDGV